MKSSALSFAGALATAAFVLHGAAALTACGGGSGGSGAGTTTATGGATTTSTTTHATGGSTTTTSTTTATGGMGTGGSASDAGSDGGGNLCTQTGGTVTEISCTCPSQGDFPSTCAIGGCTCAPGGQSHMIKTCNCPGSECYDPTNGCMMQI